MNKIDINIKSEVETLRKVLVHTPGVEMNLLNSHNTKEFNSVSYTHLTLPTKLEV